MVDVVFSENQGEEELKDIENSMSISLYVSYSGFFVLCTYFMNLVNFSELTCCNTLVPCPIINKIPMQYH